MSNTKRTGVEYLTKKQVAELLKVTQKTVQNKMKNGLPHYRFGHRTVRFKLKEVEQYMAKFRVVKRS